MNAREDWAIRLDNQQERVNGLKNIAETNIRRRSGAQGLAARPATENLSGRRLYVAFIVVFLTIFTAARAESTNSSAPAYQSHADIEGAAERAVEQRLPAGGHRREIRAQPVDHRLKLAACASALTADLPAAFARGQRLTVAVRCPGKQAWKVYVPVDVHESVDVLVATHSLARDAVLTASDFAVEQRSLAGLQRGYIADRASITGMRLKRSIRAGQIITPAFIAAPTLVRRGQRVTLVASGSGLSIAAEGLALADGALGQRIKVRNMSSRQEVEGIVRSTQRVEVLLN